MQSTTEVARALEVPEYRLHNLIRYRLLDPPPMVGRQRVWSDEDVRRARELLATRPTKAKA
jgi:DNA-binding transcriptional MerR regulator